MKILALDLGLTTGWAYCPEARTRGAYCDEHADRCYERAAPAPGAESKL